MLPETGPSSFHGVEQPFCLDVMQPFQKHSNWWLRRSPSSLVTAQLISRSWRIFLFGCYADYQQRLNQRLVVLPQTQPSSFHDVEQLFWLDIMQPLQKLSSWWLGRAPQHPLSQPSSLRGVEESFRFSLMQSINSVQMNGWSCSPKHGPAHITVLSQLFARMAWSFSKTFNT